jgi:hypothetical protein
VPCDGEKKKKKKMMMMKKMKQERERGQSLHPLARCPSVH